MKILIFLTMLLSLNAFGAAKLQDADFKTVQQLVNGGGSAAQLLNDTKVYVTANGINQPLAGAITAGLLGGGAGQNLVSNGSFEASGVSGWSLFQTTLSSLVPSSAPAACSACTFAIGAQTSGALDGTTSLQLTGASTTTPGQGFISQAFTISPAYQGQVMNVKGVFGVVSGLAALNLSGTSANSFAVYIYDVTNAQWIQPAGVYGLASNGGPFAPISFQIPSNTTSLRLAIVNTNALAASTVQLFDNLSVGPGVSASGLAGSDTKSFVASGTWNTNTVYSGRYSQTGDRVSGKINLQLTGAPNNVGLILNFIPGLTIDTTKLAGPNRSFYGRCVAIGANGAYPFDLNAAGNAFELIWQNNTAGQTTGVTGTQPFAWANGHSINCTFLDVPVVGLQSNVTQSSDYDGRNVSFYGTQSVGVGPNVDIPLNVTRDYAGAWNGTQYVVQAAGDYFVSGTTLTSGQPYSGRIGVNGTTFYNVLTYVINSSTNAVGSVLITNLKVGDKISLQGTINGTNLTFIAGTLSIMRMPGSSPVIQASQSVIASYALTAAQTVAASSPIKYDTKITDNSNICSAVSTTGLCTVNISGSYEVAATFFATANGGSTPYLTVNGVAAGYFSTALNGTVVGSTSTVTALAGQTIGIYNDAGNVTYSGNTARGFGTRMSIKRVGN